jgi:replicative DNA helicase
VGAAEGWEDRVTIPVAVQNDAERRSWDKLAARQQEAALARSAIDFSSAPTWRWKSLGKLAGPLLPGDLVVVGSRTGCGKTTVGLNQVEHLTTCRVPWLYIGQEMAPEQLRRKWSALRLGYDAPAVLRNEWAVLPAGAREKVDADVVEQTTTLAEFAHFADARRVDTEQMRRWTKFAVSRGCRVIVLDHIHRMTFTASAADLTRDMAEAVRTAKELAVAHNITFVIAAQLNRPERDAALLGDYVPPPVSALKQTGALEEEADVVFLLHKALKRSTSVADLKAVRQGLRPMSDVVEPNVMAVRVGKHRLDGGAVDHTEWLVVDAVGRLTEKAPEWRTPDVESRYGV